MTIITLSNIFPLRVIQRPEGDWLATHAVLTTAAEGRLSRTGLDTLDVLEGLFGEGAGE